MNSDDTIVAISSAVGPAARMILRLSGARAIEICSCLAPALPPSAGAFYLDLSFDDLTFPAWVYLFRAPRSYTGEDLVELHIPGNPLLARMLLQAIVAAGARQAEPGEFTARAYFNGRLDLTEAEGVAATIAAQGDAELRAARQLSAGELSRRLRPVLDLLAETLALIEVGIDFSEEDVTFLAPAEVTTRLADTDALLATVERESARFETLAHEPRVVLVGRPNAGKSTLLNALAGGPRAVVSPIAGTTRDALSADVALRRGTVRVVDVAGLDAIEVGENSPDSTTASAPVHIAKQMRDRALRELETADLVLFIRDATDLLPDLALPRSTDLRVITKLDLPNRVAPDAGSLAISALTGAGMPELRDRLDELAFGRIASAPSLALNARHRECITETRAALARAAAVPPTAHEVLAMELRDALDSLGRVLGAVSPDELLGKVFSRFCIGK